MYSMESDVHVTFAWARCAAACFPPCSQAEMFGSLDWSDMKGVSRQSSGMPAYGRAKLSLLLFTFELQRRLRLTGAQVEAFAVHPGGLLSVLLSTHTRCWNCNSRVVKHAGQVQIAGKPYRLRKPAPNTLCLLGWQQTVMQAFNGGFTKLQC